MWKISPALLILTLASCGDPAPITKEQARESVRRCTGPADALIAAASTQGDVVVSGLASTAATECGAALGSSPIRSDDKQYGACLETIYAGSMMAEAIVAALDDPKPSKLVESQKWSSTYVTSQPPCLATIAP